MNIVLYVAASVLLLALNVGVFPVFPLLSGVPNLLLLFMVCVSIDASGTWYLLVAFIAGLFLDFFSGVPVGSFAGGLVLVSVVVNMVSNRYLVLELNWKYLLGLMALGYVLAYGFVWAYGWVLFKVGLARIAVDFAVLWPKVLPELLYNALLLYPVYKFAELLEDFLARLERKRYNN